MLMNEGSYMESIDLKNAYYSIRLDEKVTQFLNFNGMDYCINSKCKLSWLWAYPLLVCLL